MKTSGISSCLRLFLLLPLAGLLSDLPAQNGDRKGHVMTPPPEHWDIPAAPVVGPSEALSTFELEDGFRLELVAAEPMVHDPVAMAFDGNGRIWVAEMMGYMPDIGGKLEGETYGRISVLEDTDGDGRADRHTVFLEEYLLPRALALVDADQSLLFADNEKLYEAEIRIDGEGAITAGEVIVVDENYASGGNPEHKPNGLLYGLDNWFYNAKSDTRYRKVNGAWIREETESRGQWGIKQDNYGRLLTNTNSNLISLEEIPPGVTVRNSAHRFRSGAKSGIRDQRVWPIRITPGINRGYMDGMLDEDGYLLKPTAVSGLAYYRGDQFPEKYHGNLFIPEPAGNLVKRLVVKEDEDGFRTLSQGLEGSEFLASTDERSRMVDAFTAPDGSLYLLDFYRGIIQHQVYMTSYLRAQVEERELHLPIGLGRIYRVVHEEGGELAAAPRMQEQPSAELVEHLGHANGWWRDTAQRLLVERGATEVVPDLENVVRSHGNPLARIHAIWTLEGLAELSPALLEDALGDSHPRVVAESIRAAESLSATESAAEVRSLLTAITGTDSPIVARQLATSLGLFGAEALPELAGLVASHPDDRLLHDLAVSGLAAREADLFVALPESHGLRRSLIETVVRRNHLPQVEALREALASAGEWKTYARAAVSARRGAVAGDLVALLGEDDRDVAVIAAVIDGMIEGGKDRKFKPIPVAELAPIDVETLPDGVDPGKVDAVLALFRVGSDQEETFLLTDAHRKQFEQGQLHYQRICLGCHQVHGNGQQYLAPPLVGSEWVLGSKERLIALVMDGVTGPIEVLGKTYTAPEIQPLMPGLRINPEIDDEQLAAVLTYVRNAWGNGATPVSTEEVTRYRDSTGIRAPWPAEELRKMK